MIQKLTRREIESYLATAMPDPWIAAALARGDGLAAADVRLVRDVLIESRPIFPALGDNVDATTRAAQLAALDDGYRAVAEAAVLANGLSDKVGGPFRATAAVLHQAGGGWKPLGTAFLVSRDPPRLLTARHVIRGAKSPIRIAFAGSVGAAIPTTVPATAWEHGRIDAGLLTIDAADLPTGLEPLVPDVRAVAPRLVCAIGYPGAGGNQGRFNALVGTRCFCLGLMDPDPPDGPSKVFVKGSAWQQFVAGHDCSTEQGFSGGPVIDAETGRLLAVHINGEMMLGGRRRNLAIPAAVLFQDDDFLAAFGGQRPTLLPAAAPRRRAPRPQARGMVAGGKPRLLAAQEDWPDIRDRMYEAGVRALPASLIPAALAPEEVLDQGSGPYCVGYALAAAISRQVRDRDGGVADVSARRIYELARIHDEVPGEAYRGSTLRGAIKGFFHNGAGPLPPGGSEHDRWRLQDFAIDLRTAVQAGSYFRMRRDIDDFHAALAELGCVLLSARIHAGWTAPQDTDGRIRRKPLHAAAHAFAVIGYDREGFLVLNSWGSDWGQWKPNRAAAPMPGVAHWSYEDFSDAMIDAWVVRIAVSAPRFASRLLAGRRQEGAAEGPRRTDLAARFVPVADADLAAAGKYAFTADSLAVFRRDARRLRADSRCRHLLLTFHDGFATTDHAARRAAALGVAARDRVLSVGVAWQSALGLALEPCAAAAAATRPEDATESDERRDRRVVRALAPVAAPLWRGAVADAVAAFAPGAPPGLALGAIVAAACGRGPNPLALHVAADGLGALLMATWLEGLARRWPARHRVATLMLLSPCLPLDLWRQSVEARLGGLVFDLPIDRVRQWGTDPRRTGTDRVGAYRGPASLLLAEALGTPMVGRIDVLPATARLPGHRVVEETALSAAFLDRPEVITAMLGIARGRPVASSNPPAHRT